MVFSQFRYHPAICSSIYSYRNYGDFLRLLERILIADEPQYAGL